MRRFSYLAFTGLFMALLFSSCEKDEPSDPVIPNEEEVITTLLLKLTPDDGGQVVTFSFQDLDGDGGNPPVLINPTLDSNKVYIGSLELKNEIANPPEDITIEIMEEDEEHQFFYQSTVPGLTVTYNDADANQNPIGLQTTISTAGLANGTLKIILRHEPNKDADGVSDGDITNAGGETDIEVEFDVLVQ